MNPQPLITTTEAVDRAFYVIFGISGISLLGITLAMIYIIWRYNRKREPVPISQKEHNIWLETTWIVIPTILVGIMFWYGWEGYLSLRRIPDNAIPIHASARMWSWLFTYENGKTSDKLYVPVGQPVNIRLNSEDVLHSFYVPAFRVKRDCVPGMETYAWFVAEEPGSYDLFCAEYCGVAHSDMITTVEAIPAAEFAGWLEEKQRVADAGQGLLQKHGCLGCHSLDGSAMVGPSFQGIAGRQVSVVRNGETVMMTCDRAYLEKAILEPDVEIVAGYPPAMPPYAERLPDEALSEILDYLMGEDSGEGATDESPTELTAANKPVVSLHPGQTLAEQNGCLGCHSIDGSRTVGPGFKGLMGSERAIVKDAQKTKVLADHDYLLRAIREPSAEIVEGYPAIMPPYPDFSEDDINALQAWLETLK